MNRQQAELQQLMLEEDLSPSQDKLDILTEKMRDARDLKYHIKEVEDNLAAAKKRYLEITQRELTDLMNEVNQSFLRLPPEGNYPAFSFSLKPFYKAQIDNENPDSWRAYQWLEEQGEGDIIKRTITASLGKESEDLQEKLVDILNDLGIPFDAKYGVPWNTLTSWVKHRHQIYLNQLEHADVVPEHERIKMPPSDIFNLTIGQVVDVKESK